MLKTIFLLLCTIVIVSATSIVYSVNTLYDGNTISVLKALESIVTPTRVRSLKEHENRMNDTLLDFIGLVSQYRGYSAEDYKVKTEDGYTLVIHRLFRTDSPIKKRRAVFMQHGLYGSSDVWVVLGPAKSLAFQLADQGYDLFFGNVRGNTYSRVHDVYLPDMHNEFWNFTLDDFAVKDLKTSLDFVMNKTQQISLTYVGHSMGTTLMYMLLSAKTEYNNKINLFVNLAPVVYFQNFNLELKALTLSTLFLAKWNIAYQMLPVSTYHLEIIQSHCQTSNSTFCHGMLSSLMDTTGIDVATIMAYTPAGTSRLIIEHFYQLMLSGKLQKYDYECGIFSCKNQDVYHQDTPPEYNLTLVSAPIVLVHAESDYFGTANDVTYLQRALHSVIKTITIKDKKFNHMNFIYPVNVSELFDEILPIMLTTTPPDLSKPAPAVQLPKK